MNQYLLAPIFLGFLALVPVIILLYLLKLRRTHVVISSTILWTKSLQDLTANAPFQRLRKNLLMLLQIIIIVALAIGLARPFIKAARSGGADICLLIDRSASMNTVEQGKPRIDLAKEKALEIIDGMVGGDKMMIVAFAKSSEVLCEMTDDQRRLREAVQSIQTVDTVTCVRDAVLVASSLAQGTAYKIFGLRTVILSDGKIEDLEEIGSRAFDVNYIQVGESADNAGIVAFSVREPMEGVPGGQRQCLVLVKNESEQPLNTTLTLAFDEQVLAVEDVTVPPDDSKETLFELPAQDSMPAGILRAQLDHEDVLAMDNTAWLALRPPNKVRVLIVGESDTTSAYFLKRVLSLNPRVDLSMLAPANYADPQNTDLIIFDGFSPPVLPTATTSIFINAPAPTPGMSFGEEIANPPIVATDAEHPVMRFLNPANVTIAKSRKLILPEGAKPLISSQNTALVADISREGRNLLEIAFAIEDSNWPLRLSFPLFIQNLISWAPVKMTEKEMSIAAGNPLSLVPLGSTDTALITLPGGTQENCKLDPTRPVYYGNTNHVGIYDVVQGDQDEKYAVNLLSLNESSVKPAAVLNIGRSEVAGEKGLVEEDRELWRWFIIGALAVLVLEWWLYSRRAWL